MSLGPGIHVGSTFLTDQKTSAQRAYPSLPEGGTCAVMADLTTSLQGEGSGIRGPLGSWHFPTW